MTGQLHAHLVAHGIDQEVRGRATTPLDQLGEHPCLVEGALDGPARPRERRGESIGHLTQYALDLLSDEPERLGGLGLLVHLGHPGLQGSVRLVEAIPAIVVRVGLDPGGRAGPRPLQLRADRLDTPNQFGEPSQGFPLGLSTHVPVDPEAAPANGDDLGRLVMLLVLDQLPAMHQQRGLLETEGVDHAEVRCVNREISQPHLFLGVVRETDVDIAVHTAEPARQLLDPGELVAVRRLWDHAQRHRGFARQVRPELVDQRVAHHARASLVEIHVRGQVQTEALPQQGQQLAGCALSLDRIVGGLLREPPRDEVLVRLAAEDHLEQRRPVAGAALFDEAHDVLIADPLRIEHLVDPAIGEAPAQHVASESPELWLVGDPPLLQLHQQRALTIPFDAGEVDDQRRRLIDGDRRLDGRAHTEEGTGEPHQVGLLLADDDAVKIALLALDLLQLVDERRELLAGVVEAHHAADRQLLRQLTGKVVVERVHQPSPSRCCFSTARAIRGASSRSPSRSSLPSWYNRYHTRRCRMIRSSCSRCRRFSVKSAFSRKSPGTSSVTRSWRDGRSSSNQPSWTSNGSRTVSSAFCLLWFIQPAE